MELENNPDVNDFNMIREILKPYDANLMRRYPVSGKLNNSTIDDEEAESPVNLKRNSASISLSIRERRAIARIQERTRLHVLIAPHSCLSATTGSTLIARLAGMQQASSDTSASTTVTQENVQKSFALIPASKFASTRARP